MPLYVRKTRWYTEIKSLYIVLGRIELFLMSAQNGYVHSLRMTLMASNKLYSFLIYVNLLCLFSKHTIPFAV